MQSALFIGRFQPFHKGHLEIIKQILKKNKRVIIVIGSAEKNFLKNDPLTAGERYQLIEESLKESKIPDEKFRIIPVQNINNYAIWVNHVNTYVPPYTRLYTGSKIARACYENKYIKPLGPEIIQIKKRYANISATKIRDAILKNKKWEHMVPKTVAKRLEEWQITKRLKSI